MQKFSTQIFSFRALAAAAATLMTRHVLTGAVRLTLGANTIERGHFCTLTGLNTWPHPPALVSTVAHRPSGLCTAAATLVENALVLFLCTHTTRALRCCVSGVSATFTHAQLSSDCAGRAVCTR